MTKMVFEMMFKECGFTSYLELADFLKIHPQTLNLWNKNEKHPKYIQQILEYLIILKNFEECNLNIEELKEENRKLKKELEILERNC